MLPSRGKKILNRIDKRYGSTGERILNGTENERERAYEATITQSHPDMVQDV